MTTSRLHSAGERGVCLTPALHRLNSGERCVHVSTATVCRYGGSKVRAGEKDAYRRVRPIEINTQGSSAGPGRADIDRGFSLLQSCAV